MRQTAIAMLALVVLLSMASFPAKVSGATDEYESLEFFLDQSLKREKDPEKRVEILNRYLIKALGLVYQQNQELIRLQQPDLECYPRAPGYRKKRDKGDGDTNAEESVRSGHEIRGQRSDVRGQGSAAFA